MGQIWDFSRSVSVHFGAPRQNVLNLILKSPRFDPFGLKLILKSPRFVPFGANFTLFSANPDILSIKCLFLRTALEDVTSHDDVSGHVVTSPFVVVFPPPLTDTEAEEWAGRDRNVCAYIDAAPTQRTDQSPNSAMLPRYHEKAN